MSENKNIPLAKVIDPPRVDFEAEGMAYEADIVYANLGGFDCKLDLFYSKTANKPMPVIVWFHGGGWSSEDLTRKYRPEQELAVLAREGFFIVSADYRLIQQTPFPACLQDCKCVIRWVRAHAEKYGLDPDRVGVIGESAGGHLVALLGVTDGIAELEGDGPYQEYSSRVQAVIPWYAPADMAGRTEGDRALAMAQRFCGTDDVQEADRIMKLMSPIRHMDRTDLPPFLFVHGNADRLVPYQNSVDMCEKMKANGMDAELVTVDGQGHGFFDGQEYYEAMYAFFRRVLG